MKKTVTIALLSIFAAIFSGADSANANTFPGNISARSKSLETFVTFADWCFNRERLPPKARYTVDLLLEEAETGECDRAVEAIANRTKLTLNDKGIQDATPLASLTHLTELGLAGNPIDDLERRYRIQKSTCF